MFRPKIWISGLIGLVLVLLVGYYSSAHTDNPKPKDDSNKITIGMVTFPGYAPLYLAQDKGFFKQEGLEVELVRIEDLSQMRAGINNGSLDMYAATYDMFLSANSTTPYGKAFLALDESKGADGIVVSSEISSIADLKGKTVAAEPGFPPHLILQHLLYKEGLTQKDVNFVDTTTIDAGSAFASGKVDAAALYEPVLSSSMQQRKGSKLLASSQDTPGLIQDFLFVNPELLSQNPEILVKLTKSWGTAVEYIKENPDESYSLMAKHFEVTPEEMREFNQVVYWKSLSDNQALFQSNQAYQVFSEVCKVMTLNELVNACPNPYESLTGEIVNSISK